MGQRPGPVHVLDASARFFALMNFLLGRSFPRAPSQGALDVAGLLHVEDDDRKVVVHTQGDGGVVHDTQAPVEDLDVRQLVKARRLGVLDRVGIVHAVDLGRLHDAVRADLQCAQRGRGVCREVRVAGARREDDHAALLKVPDSAAPDVGLGNRLHLDGGHDAGEHRVTLERVLERQGVHDSREHAHVVGLRAVHAARCGGQPAEDVAASDDDRDLHAVSGHRVDLLGKRIEDLGIDTGAGVAHERFAGQLEENSLEVVPGNGPPSRDSMELSAKAPTRRF